MDRTHSFGYWLRRRRKALDLTQAELAQRASCSLELIQKIEVDARRPSRQMAEKLADVLGIDVSERAAFIQAARAERAVDQLDVATQPVEQPQRSPQSNLPAQLTSLIGREQEIATIASRLRRPDVRLVTLTGPGGIGKTRLSLQVATELLGNFPHGVWFIDLAPIREPNLVTSQIATALGVKEAGAQPLLATLKAHLRDKQMLLLLDNFEQVIDAAPLVSELLASAPQLKVLVTSREVLKLRGEKEIAVPPLVLPDLAQLPSLEQLSQYAAVALFIQRALDTKPDFEVTNATAPAVAEICARLDGLPLAIELAAARLKLFSPEALLSRLSSRLALLSAGPRDLPARQQTIRNTIAWSYHLLNEDEQTLFRRLGVFVGGCTLEAINTVCTLVEAEHRDLFEEVTALVDKSLLRQVDEPEGTARFVMLETIREYALERLEESGETEMMRRQHARYYEAFSFVQPGENEETYARRMSRHYDNVRSALEWSQTNAGDSEIALRLVDALTPVWFDRSVRHEAIATLRRTLDHPLGVGRTVAHAYARWGLAIFLGLTGNYRAARTEDEQALTLAFEQDDSYSGLRAEILSHLGWLAREQGDSTTAWKQLTAGLTIFRELGHADTIATTLNTLAGVAILDEDPARAEALLAESQRVVQRAASDATHLAWTLNHLGHTAQLRGDYDRAAQLHQESFASFPSRNHIGLLWAYHSLGETALGRQRIAEAARWLGKGLALAQMTSDQAGIAWCLAGLGSAAALSEKPERAARLWGAAERLRQSIGCRPAPAARATYERAMALAHAQLGEDAFVAAWAAGQALTLEQAIAEALGD